MAFVALLAFGGAAGWAFYTRSTTGSFPPVIDNLLGKFYDVPQDPHSLKQSGTLSQNSNTNQTGSISQPVSSGPQTAPNNPSAPSAPTVFGAAATTTTPSATGTAAANDNSGDAAAAAVSTSAPAPASSQPSPAVSNSSAPSTASLQPVSAKRPNIPDAAVNGPTGTGGSDSSPNSQVNPQNQGEPAPEVKTPEKPKHQAPLTVDGFARKDVPELMHLAEVAAQRGDYRLAIYEYNLILKLEPGNLAARKKLQLVHAAQSTN